MINIMTDHMDNPIARLFRGMIERTQKISQPDEHLVKGFDPRTRSPVYGTIRIEIKDALGRLMPEFDSTHIGDLVVLGKDDPLIFAADVVVNTLHNHLGMLGTNAPLNEPSSIDAWELRERVYGVREGAFEDKI